MTDETKAFLKGLDSQMHKGSVWDFEGANTKLKKQIDDEKQFAASIQAEKQRKAEEKKKWEKWDASISKDSVRLLLPGIDKTIQDNKYSVKANLSDKSIVIKEERTGSLLGLEKYSTDEIKEKLERAQNLQSTYAAEALIAESDSSREGKKALVKEQACLVSIYQNELDQRSDL